MFPFVTRSATLHDCIESAFDNARVGGFGVAELSGFVDVFGRHDVRRIWQSFHFGNSALAMLAQFTRSSASLPVLPLPKLPPVSPVAAMTDNSSRSEKIGCAGSQLL